MDSLVKNYKKQSPSFVVYEKTWSLAVRLSGQTGYSQFTIKVEALILKESPYFQENYFEKKQRKKVASFL
jgi:hypothetical protein